MTEFGCFNGVRTAWRVSGSGEDVVLLHGWGQNMMMMSEIEKHLSRSFHVFNLDFPGHGESDEPPAAWGVEDYVIFLKDFMRQNEIEKVILIAHSFGCRVAIHCAAEEPQALKKMVLTGAAGLKPPVSLETGLKRSFYKFGKKVLLAAGKEETLKKLQEKNGSEDYRNAQGVMRGTFVKVVNDDVGNILKDVLCPVLLVWGEKDAAVPLSDGKRMEREMKDAGLAVFENDDHFAYWNQPERFNRVLDIFLKEDMT